MNLSIRLAELLAFACLAAPAQVTNRPALGLASLTSPIIFQGDAHTAYRDPAAIYHDGVFHLYFTLVKIEPDGKPYSYTAWSKSRDLAHWAKPKIFTPRDRELNFSSPGNVIRFRDQWVLCLQTYPRPHGEKFGNESARVWIMRSDDLEHWSPAELLRVKGPDMPVEQMGRMIDPYLVEDKDEPGRWWCFFKQNGASRSWSRSLAASSKCWPRIASSFCLRNSSICCSWLLISGGRVMLVMRAWAPASSTRSMALSGKNRSLM